MKYSMFCILLLLVHCAPQPEQAKADQENRDSLDVALSAPEDQQRDVLNRPLDPIPSSATTDTSPKLLEKEPNQAVSAEVDPPPKEQDRPENLAPETGSTHAISDKGSVQAVQPKREKSQVFALLVGINKYRNLTDLMGAVNDVKLMKHTLVHKFGVPEAHIATLVNEQATRAAIVARFEKELIEKVGPKDRAIFHFSGHGSQIDDASADEPDGLDETLVPHDSREAGIFDLSDDEINGLLTRLAERCEKVTFILDSCHSSSGQKPGNWRKISRDKRPPPAGLASSLGDGSSQGMITAGKMVELAACGTTEVAGETSKDGVYYGALTFQLVQILNRMQPGTTWQQIMPELIRGVQQRHRGQTPQLSGQRDRVVFGVREVAAPNHVTVQAVEGKIVTLDAGLAHGMTVGSVFALHAANSPPPQATRLGRATVKHVDAFTAQATVDTHGPIPIGAWALEIEHRADEHPLKLALMPHGNEALFKGIRSAIESSRERTLVNFPEDADLVISADSQAKRLLFADHRGNPMGGWISADKEAALEHALRAWAKWFRVKAIQSAVGIQPEVAFQLARNDRYLADETPAEKEHGLTIGIGEKVFVRVENKSRRDLFPVVLLLLPSGQIYNFFPGNRPYQPLSPGKDVVFSTLAASLPEGVAKEHIAFKLMLTRKPVSFTQLLQPEIGNYGALDTSSNVASTRGGKEKPAAFSVIQKTVTIKRDLNDN